MSDEYYLDTLPDLSALADEILWVQADGGYTHLHLKSGQRIVTCKTIGVYESLLPPEVFMRIHKNHLVCLLEIRKYYGEQVVLSNGLTLPVAKRRKEVLDSWMNENNREAG